MKQQYSERHHLLLFWFNFLGSHSSQRNQKLKQLLLGTERFQKQLEEALDVTISQWKIIAKDTGISISLNIYQEYICQEKKKADT